jgi:hypothetical protein
VVCVWGAIRRLTHHIVAANQVGFARKDYRPHNRAAIMRLQAILLCTDWSRPE